MNGTPFRLKANIEAGNPGQLFERLQAHLIEHDVEIRLSGNTLSVDLASTSGQLCLTGGSIAIDVFAADLETLYFVKVWLQNAVAEDADARSIRIRWSEDCLPRHLPPSFCVLTVDAVTDITPRLRRISFRASDVRTFDTLENMHLRILFNFRAIAEQHAWREYDRARPSSDVAPIWRPYTVRSADPATGTIAVEFVLHDAEGPGSRWARHAKRGDVVGAAGPSGGGVRPAEWYLLAGDETALPAISRILEALDESATAMVVIETGSRLDRLSLASRATVEIKWLYRDTDDDCRGGLARAISDMEFPDAPLRKFAWVACESDIARAVRATLRDRGFTKEEQTVAAYWHAR